MNQEEILNITVANVHLGKTTLCFQSINKAMVKDHQEFNIGVLDIYGFEIFQVSVLSSSSKVTHGGW